MLQTFDVANIKCGGCANTVTKKLTEAGFKELSIDLSCEPRKVTVFIENETKSKEFTKLLKKLGYPLFDENLSTLESSGLKAKSYISCAVGKFSLNDDTTKI